MNAATVATDGQNKFNKIVDKSYLMLYNNIE